mgnify:FL=1
MYGWMLLGCQSTNSEWQFLGFDCVEHQLIISFTLILHSLVAFVFFSAFFKVLASLPILIWLFSNALINCSIASYCLLIQCRSGIFPSIKPVEQVLRRLQDELWSMLIIKNVVSKPIMLEYFSHNYINCLLIIDGHFYQNEVKSLEAMTFIIKSK